MREIKTKTNFIIGSSKDSINNYAWFIRHPRINNGEAMPINKGHIEYFLDVLRRELMKTDKDITVELKDLVFDRTKLKY